MKTTSDNLTFSLAVVTTLWVVCAGCYLCYVNPEDPLRYLLAIALLCIGWGARYLIRGNVETCGRLTTARHKVTQAILFAGLIFSVAFIPHLGWIDGFSDFGARTRGFVTGAFVIFMSNTIPKEAGPVSGFAMRRAVGWAMVLGGLGYTLAWLLPPLAYATYAAMLAIIVALAYSIGRFLWFIRKERSNRPTGAE